MSVDMTAFQGDTVQICASTYIFESQVVLEVNDSDLPALINFICQPQLVFCESEPFLNQRHVKKLIIN